MCVPVDGACVLVSGRMSVYVSVDGWVYVSVDSGSACARECVFVYECVSASGRAYLCTRQRARVYMLVRVRVYVCVYVCARKCACVCAYLREQ